jgi:lipopolysaccharide/colanic/teichoic acid biosynthesis glycosyltransferase
MFRADFEVVLRVRPGITDPASIRFRHEAEILGRAADPEKEYVERILPEKLRLAKDYVRQSSFWYDVALLFKTALALGSGDTAEKP